LSVFDGIGSKAREIAGGDIVTIGNEESCPWQQRNFKSKTFSPKFLAPHSTDNRSIPYGYRIPLEVSRIQGM